MKNSTRLGRGGLGRFGTGNIVQELPTSRAALQTDFSGGYDTRVSSRSMPRNATPLAIDLEVSDKNEIIRAPGVAAIETFTGRTPGQLVPHASLDLDAELLLFDAPYIGVFDGSSTVWTNKGLPAGTYAWTNFGGTLVFSSGTGAMYARKPDGTVGVVANAPAAKAYANFAGRIFAANVEDSGAVLPLGIMWSAASSMHDDWTGIGAGAEELISNRLEVDYIQALVPLGFDVMAVVMRRSLWVALRTGQTNRPADFQSRVEGEGAVSSRCVAATPRGVAFLTDDGLKLFDGTSVQSLSEPIDAHMLPESFDSVDGMELYYHEGSDRLYLVLPTGTWIFDFKHSRWYRRSLVVRAAASFGLSTLDTYEMYFLGTDSRGRVTLGQESSSSVRFFDAPVRPLWEFPLETGEYVNQILSTTRLHLEYRGGGTLELLQPNTNGEFVLAHSQVLPQVTGDRPALLSMPFTHSGLGLGLQLRVLSGQPVISAVGVEFVLQGPRIPPATARSVYLVPVQLASGSWILLPFAEAEGQVTGGYRRTASGALTLHAGQSGSSEVIVRRVKDSYVTKIGV